MSKKSRTAQRRKKKRRRQSRTLKMHQALGEFLTEMGRIEFRMLLLLDYLEEASLEALFETLSKQTFGQKIEIFEELRDSEGVHHIHKAKLQTICEDLNKLLPKRNSLIHGETRVAAFEGKPRQPYRVGVTKKEDIEYLAEFHRAQHGENVFDVQQVRDVTEHCKKIHQALFDMRE